MRYYTFALLFLVLPIAFVYLLYVVAIKEQPDPGCNPQYPIADPSSRVPEDGDVIEWRCISDHKGHLRLAGRVKPVQEKQ